MTDLEEIIESTQDSIKIIKLNKPARKNAFDVNMYIRIAKILEDTAADDKVTVAVITGSGDYFSSGNDLKAVLEFGKADVNPTLMIKNFVEAFIQFPKTLIAIVNGPAIGIAATTLALFDLVFAVENVTIY